MTLRELLAMAEARQRDAWARTASVMALIANTQRNPKKIRAFKPSDFSPFNPGKKSNKHSPKVGVDVLKSVFFAKRVPDLASEKPEGMEAQ